MTMNDEEAYEIADRVQALIDRVAERDPLPETQDDDPDAPDYFAGFSIYGRDVADHGVPDPVRAWMDRHFGASRVRGDSEDGCWRIAVEA